MADVLQFDLQFAEKKREKKRRDDIEAIRVNGANFDDFLANNYPIIHVEISLCEIGSPALLTSIQRDECQGAYSNAPSTPMSASHGNHSEPVDRHSLEVQCGLGINPDKFYTSGALNSWEQALTEIFEYVQVNSNLAYSKINLPFTKLVVYEGNQQVESLEVRSEMYAGEFLGNLDQFLERISSLK